MEKFVLAHSGGLETAAAIPWLIEKHRAEVVTLTLDVGQGGSLDDIHERALALGAARAHVLDVREEFARDFMLPALQGGEVTSPIAMLNHAITAKHLAAIAEIEGAVMIDDVRQLRGFTLDKAIAAARRRGVPLPAAKDPHVEANLWGREVPEDSFRLTKAPSDAPDLPAHVDIAFDHGTPVAVNGVEMAFVELIQSLQTIAGAHGVGRESDPSRVPCEAPAAVCLLMAHAELRAAKSPDASGVVRLRLHKGECEAVRS